MNCLCPTGWNSSLISNLLTEKTASSNPPKVTSKLSLLRRRAAILFLSCRSTCFPSVFRRQPHKCHQHTWLGLGSSFCSLSQRYSRTVVHEFKALLNHIGSLNHSNPTLKNTLEASAPALDHKRWVDCNPCNRRPD